MTKIRRALLLALAATVVGCSTTTGLAPTESRAGFDGARVVDIAPRSCRSAIGRDDRAAFVARIGGRMAGFVIVDRKDPALPEIDWLIVHPDFHGAGVAGRLMNAAFAWIGEGRAIKLGVIGYNRRAIAFYEKHGFRDTGRVAGTHKIPRKLMIRPA